MLVAQAERSFNPDATQYTAAECDASSLHRLTGTISQPRSFTSRHVPGVVEGLATSLGSNPLTANAMPNGQRQLQGLLAHLKQASSAAAERQKQAMATDAVHLVPEEFDQLLRAVFERRCSFGDQSNTEYMNSAKWSKLLRDGGIISGLHGFPPKGGSSSQDGRTVTLAISDLVFQKVLHDVEYGSKRLDYSLFCKALLLVAQKLHSDLDDTAALAQIVMQITTAVGESQLEESSPYADLLLDPNVVVTLDLFKPALFDLFHTVCLQKTDSPGQAKPGLGTSRQSERTYRRYASTQGLTGRSISMAALNNRAVASRELARRQSASSLSSCRTSDSTCEPDSRSASINAGMETLRTGSEQSDAENVSPAAFDKAKAFDGGDRFGGEELLIHEEEEAERAFGALEAPPLEQPSVISAGYPSGSFRNVPAPCGDEMVQGQTQASYLNGAPVVRDRCRRASIDQLMYMCTCLDIVPEFASRLEVVSIFKRAQHTGFSHGHGSSLHGYLTYEEFVDAIGQLSIMAYSKQPFSEEYPEAHDKVEAFLLRVLPSDQRLLRERFLYGRRN